MWPRQNAAIMLSFLVQFLALASGNSNSPKCKAVPGSSDWPSLSQWAALNSSLNGRLLQPSPPGAVCHPTQPTFNAAACPAVQAGWLTSIWHSNDPVSTIENNWNNDTCLPIPTLPCSGLGYPVYVVNATCADDVKHGVDFARKNNIRLVVKGTGHDYLGRSVAPNALSIWTHHMQGLSFHDGFKPKGCTDCIDTHAITAAAGTQMLEIDREASLRNLTIVSGGAGTVGMGGYLTGGGHGALSSTYGLAADQVLQIEMVTPHGKIITANECQHRDLFWAMRGGGGSTFGVITSVTIRAFPSPQFVVATAYIATIPGTEAYWDVFASVLAQFPKLDAQGISAYTFLVPSFMSASLNITSAVDAYSGVFILPLLHPDNSSATLTAAINDVFNTARAPYPAQFFTSVTATTYPNFWTWYQANNGPLDAGSDVILGSRLLDEKALTTNATAVKEAFKTITPSGGSTSIYLVSGKNVWNAETRGGSNAVNSAWRKAYVHTVISGRWAPLDAAAKAQQENLMTNTYVAALRKLAPDMGAYVNEADSNEPSFQESFWGTNYPRLLSIKRRFDPDDVLWCHPCVGNERWEEVGDQLCKVS